MFNVFSRKKKDRPLIIKQLPELSEGFSRADNVRPDGEMYRYFTIDGITFLAYYAKEDFSGTSFYMLYKSKDLSNWELINEIKIPKTRNLGLKEFFVIKGQDGKLVFGLSTPGYFVLTDLTTLNVLADTTADAFNYRYYNGKLYQTKVELAVREADSATRSVEFCIEELVIKESGPKGIVLKEKLIRNSNSFIALHTFDAMGLSSGNPKIGIDVASSINLVKDKSEITVFRARKGVFMSDVSHFNDNIRKTSITEISGSMFSKACAYSTLFDKDSSLPYVALYRAGKVVFLDADPYRISLSKNLSSVLFPNARFIHCLEQDLVGFVTRNGNFFNDRMIGKRVLAYSTERVKQDDKWAIKVTVKHRRQDSKNVLMDMSDTLVYETPLY